MRIPVLQRKTAATDWRVVHQVASWCLSYPDDQLLELLPTLRAALDEQPDSEPVALLAGVVDTLLTTSPDDLRHSYVDVFDLSRKHTLYLTYWTDGDTRRRGEALAAVKQLYRDSGFVTDLRGELPDHLPIVLEFCARADPEGGVAFLGRYRTALEQIGRALRDRCSGYADVLTALVLTLPEVPDTFAPAPAQIPVETVGLEPYDPRLLPLNPVAGPARR
ncbi:MAG: nitrate reductase molybdenum cofactor assembly chaperone [Gordonia amarae]